MISVALIVKNEEHTLGRCLNSLRSAVDEIVVVDTGSDDATREVARRYTDHVFDFAWRNDFSAARQFAFDQAQCEWVMWVDADDVAIHAERIRPLLANAPAAVSGFYWRYVTDRDVWGNSQCEFWRERCVRNDGSFQWVGPVHEVLAFRGTGTGALVQSDDVVIEHRPERRRTMQKLSRNLEIMEAERDNSGSVSPRLLFYLANDTASAGDSEKALLLYERYLQVSEWDDERYIAHTRVAGLRRARGEYRAALEADQCAVDIHPDWPDSYFGLAESNYYLKDWAAVIRWTELGRAKPKPRTLLFINPLAYDFHWIIYYASALYHLGAAREALGWTKRALEIVPDDPRHRENFFFFAEALRQDSPASATLRAGESSAVGRFK
jgi:Glycosyl transferase family 2